jgi:hypothetical protein
LTGRQHANHPQTRGEPGDGERHRKRGRERIGQKAWIGDRESGRRRVIGEEARRKNVECRRRGVSNQNPNQRAEQLGQPRGPNREARHHREGAGGSRERRRGLTAVRGGMLEQHVGADLSEFQPDGDDDNTRNHGWKQFSCPVDEGRHGDLTGASEDHHAANGREPERRCRPEARWQIDGRDDRRTKVARTNRSEPQTLENSHECNRDHGEANGALRGVVRQFRGFRD